MTRRCSLLCTMVLALAALPGCLSAFSFFRKGPARDECPSYEEVQESKDISQISGLKTVQRNLDLLGTLSDHPIPADLKFEQAKPLIEPVIQPTAGKDVSQNPALKVAT